MPGKMPERRVNLRFVEGDGDFVATEAVVGCTAHQASDNIAKFPDVSWPWILEQQTHGIRRDIFGGLLLLRG